MVDQVGVRLRLAAVFAAVTAVGLAGGFGLATAGATGTHTLYAYAESTPTTGLTTCDVTAVQANQCSLAEALTVAASDTGDTIDLVGQGTGSTATEYVGNWTAAAAGTSAAAPLTIESAPGLTETLTALPSTGNSCETTSCASSILSTSGAAYLTVQGVTFTGSTAGTATDGGALNVEGGSAVTVTGSVFTNNHATSNGGAIAVGVDGGTGSLTVTGNSSFSGNTATKGGGAIANGIATSASGSHGTSTIAAGTTFADNTATGDGGAIDSGDNGTGTLDVTGSTFTGNVGHYDAGAIGNGGDGGTGTATITDSLFNANAAGVSGGAIDNGDNSGTGVAGGSGTLTVRDSTFTANAADGSPVGDGGAINNAEDLGTGTVTVTGTTFASNTATTHGPSIDNSDGSTGGTVNAAGDLFAGGCDLAGGTWHDGGYNVGTDATCDNGALTDIASTSASLLGTLQANGGMTDTEYLLAGNAGISVIPSGYSGDGVQLCPRTDQRGVGSSASCSAGSVDSLAVTGPASTSATAGSAYSGTVSAAGGSGAYSYTVSAGAPLPAGLSLNQTTGAISGTPTQSGTIASTINVSDTGTQQGGVARLSFTIAAGPVTPTTPPTSTSGTPSGTPKITATLISAHAKTKFGWYRSPVKITFACTTNGATLTTACPASVLLTKSGENQVVTRTIKTTVGLTATVTVRISIDETLPIITIKGIHPGATYTKLPKVTCTATDKLSHVASCTVKGTASKPTGPLGTRIVTYRATAITRAGITVTKIARVRFRR